MEFNLPMLFFIYLNYRLSCVEKIKILKSDKTYRNDKRAR